LVLLVKQRRPRRGNRATFNTRGGRPVGFTRKTKAAATCTGTPQADTDATRAAQTQQADTDATRTAQTQQAGTDATRAAQTQQVDTDATRAAQTQQAEVRGIQMDHLKKSQNISKNISFFKNIFSRSILLNIFEADFFPLHCTSAKKRMAPHPQNQCCQAQDCETHLGSIDFFGGAILFFRACTRGAIF